MTPAAADLITRLVTLYPVLAELPPESLREVIEAHAHFVTVPDGTTLFDEGAACEGFPMVISGAVRVARGSPGGRTLELYRVTPGEMCVVSLACLFGQSRLSAFGQAVETTELVILKPQGLDAWCQHAAFRRFVFGVFGDRMADLMALAEAVAFQRLDQRLAQALLGHGNSLQTTHQALADSLGTVREIVSRLLSRFERAGWVRLSRERIDVLDGAALRHLAGGQGPTPDG